VLYKRLAQLAYGRLMGHWRYGRFDDSIRLWLKLLDIGLVWLVVLM
jgi:hypothetical protein